ncbi:transposase family protein [Planctomycetes bacterium CA13]|uniref:transposase family protein n=1 Tax=Novipirellula herctigrandis TaxID=2527986 RepID=UPI0011B79ED7
MTIPADGELLAILAAIPDPRRRLGRRHPLAAMLAATICGLLTGATGCTAIA